jgi:hypothetical protein
VADAPQCPGQASAAVGPPCFAQGLAAGLIRCECGEMIIRRPTCDLRPFDRLELSGSSADAALAVKNKIAPKRLAATVRTGARQVIASQIDRENGCSTGFRLCRLRAAVARSRRVGEAAASAHDRCTMPPVDASPVHWSPWQGNWFTGGTPLWLI